MAQLTGGPERVVLAPGVTLVAPGLRGSAEVLQPSAARGLRALEESTPLLDDVLRRAEMNTVRTIEIRAVEVPGVPGPTVLRDVNGDDALLLELPDLGEEAGQVVMSVDEAGAITWHFAMENGEVQPPSRGGATQRFLIRKGVPSVAPGTTGTDRALFGSLGRKLLKVIVFPITDRLIGKSANAIAEHWESANRAYGLRSFTTANYRQPTITPDDRNRVALSAADAATLPSGPALLFVHGTFSTANGAFHDIPPDLLETLHRRYGGRVFAFNHFTLAHEPAQNVREFMRLLDAVSPGTQLEVDVVSHSRGGLVTRTLAEGRTMGLGTDRVRVRRAVFVGVPNAGTRLADPDHMISMIDRLTTGLNLVPPGGVADILEGLLIAVKIIGHGALKGLAGLRAQDPAGDFLRNLNRGGAKDAQYFGISANYEPHDTGLRSLVRGAADAVVDRVFDAENDLVVPERGVYAANGSDSFPLKEERRLQLGSDAGVMHTTMFGNPEVTRRIGEWLQ
jgi:hypothetical protein